MASAGPNTSLSKIFCDSSADLVFESSDEVLFKIHSKHLSSTSFGLAMEEADRAVESQPAKLSEPAEILEILFQFVEPPSESRHYQYPSLTELEPLFFFALAEAAEKYIVFACMGMCVTRMRFDSIMMGTYALDILNYSFKHGYNDLVLKAITPTLRNCDFELVAVKLTAPGLLVQWLKYYGMWKRVADFGDTTFAATNATYQCPKLYAKWSAYNRQCACSPDQAGVVVHSYAGAPAQITGLPCLYNRGCPCVDLRDIAAALLTKTNALPSFDSL